MTTTMYDFCGLGLRSEIELHLPVSSGDRWDLDITWGGQVDASEPPEGEVLASLDIDDGDFDEGGFDDDDEPDDDFGHEGGWWYRAVRTEDGYVVRFNRCGEFRISSDLDRVEVCPDPDGRNDLLPILMAGTVGAILLAMRGATVLHASAVLVEDRVVAFVAPSGGGKSTLAALLCQHGAELVTDDVLVVDSGPPPQCAGGANELRLRPAAASLAATGVGSARATTDGRTAFAPCGARSGLLPLAVIISPYPSREVADLEVEELSGGERLLALMDEPRIFGWTDPDILSRDLTTLGQVVSDVPVLEVTVPWGPPFAAEVVEALLDLVRRS